MALAAALLLPFLNTPFTIDDPMFLREAQQALTDPFHPQSATIVWDNEVSGPVSQITPGGVFVAYPLIPTALSGCKEWVGHLTELVLLLVALLAVARVSLRLGLDQGQARAACLLTGVCPAVVGAAGTLLPDIQAMLLTILGMERILAWREDRKWHQALGATCWLTLAALTRPHTVVVLAAAFVFLLDGITGAEIRASFRRFPVRFLPLVLTPVLFLVLSALAADQDSRLDNMQAMAERMPSDWHYVFRNGLAFLAHWLLVIPLTIPWLVLRFRRISAAVLLVPLVGASLLSVRLGWIAFAAAATCIVLADILWDAMQRRDGVQLALWLWLVPAIPAALYIHLPSKYLLPSVPAAAMLVARLIPESRRATTRWLIPTVAGACVILSFLILSGIRDLAVTQKRAVAELIAPRIERGEHVWFAGHWGFQWYAELAGASPMTLDPPRPQPGETVVVSLIDLSSISQKWTARKVVRHFCYISSPMGRVMDPRAGAGFFSNPFGYLPWVWGRGRESCFEVWEAE
jgi:hypothetical protein